MKWLILYLPSYGKALLLSLIVFLGSSIRAAFSPHVTFLADSQNPLNLYYVKWSWAWTLLPLLPAVIMTSFLYTRTVVPGMLSQLLRVGVSHVIWYATTNLFNWYRDYTSTCSNDHITNKSLCISSGFQWLDGIDISGHIFLLVYCTLVITEEFRTFDPPIWKNYKSIIRHNYCTTDWKLALSLKIYNSKSTSVFIFVLELIATIEIVLNILMVTCTALFFHIFVENIIALGISIFLWYMTYHFIYINFDIGTASGLLNPLSQK